ncbi:MAG: gfo/Idh/MocA family oxidoreductase [Alphaproteobacteria bacterium]|nr:MAG: gfo/Idh/MocA family oxidoreductase [Alphaproteobacteria bacterium]
MTNLIRLGERQEPRVGVIGCGDWGSNHVRTLAGLGALEAVADNDAGRMARLAGEHGCRTMSPEQLVAAPDIDAVVLALPAELHARTAIAAIEAGKHVLVEKPMALRIEDARAIVEAARARGVVAMTGHVLRFHPAFEALERLVREGALGRIRYVYSTRIGLGKFFTNTDALWDIAPHDLSLLLAITGEAPETVHLEGAAMITEAPDFAHLHMTFASGARSHTFISRLAPHRERKFTVIGDAAMAVVDDLQPPEKKLAVYNHKVWNDGDGIRFESAEPHYVELPQTLPLTSELEHFLDSIRSGRTPRASVAEGLEVLEVLARAETQKERISPNYAAMAKAGE